MTVKVTMLGRTMTEESDIIKRIQRNNIREKEIVQALENVMEYFEPNILFFFYLFFF